jgi:hypothetical protein
MITINEFRSFLLAVKRLVTLILDEILWIHLRLVIDDKFTEDEPRDLVSVRSYDGMEAVMSGVRALVSSCASFGGARRSAKLDTTSLTHERISKQGPYNEHVQRLVDSNTAWWTVCNCKTTTYSFYYIVSLSGC